MSEVPISEAGEHISELAGVQADTGTHELPPDIMAQIHEARRHPERDRPRPRRASRTQRDTRQEKLATARRERRD